LFQLNPVIWNNIIKNSFTFIVKQNIFLGILLVLVVSSIIFIYGIAIEFIRSKIFKLIKVPSLSRKIVVILNKILNKVTEILN
jgi:hypothetical protein